MLQEKYAEALNLADKLGMRGKEVREEEGKLKWRGSVHGALEKNELWDAIKRAGGSNPQDIVADIQMDGSVPAPQYPTHKVAAGETLSKLAKRYLGDASAYERIFRMNGDQLSDPDRIKVGQVLKIPFA